MSKPEVKPEVVDSGMSIQDMALVLRIVDLASERGAFKGAELSTVGQIRDKVASFIKANLPATTAEKEAAE
jgi:hypothetical protein